MNPQVTIDTNCINAREKSPALNRLEELAREGQIEITAAFVLGQELTTDHTKWGDARRTKASTLRTGWSGFLVGRSGVGGLDLVGGAIIYAAVPRIQGILAPERAWEDVDANTQRDILHLAVHLTYGWDLFVTQDTGILRKRDLLLRNEGIRVMEPDEAVTWIAEMVPQSKTSRTS